MERTEIIKVRVSPDEKAYISNKANDQGISVSEYVRRGAIQKIIREQPGVLSKKAAHEALDLPLEAVALQGSGYRCPSNCTLGGVPIIRQAPGRCMVCNAHTELIA